MAITKDNDKIFLHDNRKENSGLHMLYVKWACKHLTAIDRTIKKFDDFSNINMIPIIEALVIEREKLCNEYASYHDANEILEEIESEK